jgi:hypothetical protein
MVIRQDMKGCTELTGDVGGFQMSGKAIMWHDGRVKYVLSISWHDKIDPNPTYDSDVWFADGLNKLYTPEDYQVHIYWNDVITIPRNEI